MTDDAIEKYKQELMSMFPKCRIQVAADKQEIVAGIRDGFAVAVIERSVPHFHRTMRELYRVLRGRLYVACGGRGYILNVGELFCIESSLIHYAKAVGEPAWVEVESDPPWSPEDHHTL